MKIYTKTQEILSDTLTPISAFLSLRDVYANVSLFESSEYHSRENARSYICVTPMVSIEVTGNDLQLRAGDELIHTTVISDSSDLQSTIDMIEFQECQTNLRNGFFGVIGYEAISLFEDIQIDKRSAELPDIFLAAYQFVLEFDHFHNRLKIMFNSFDPEENQLAVIMNLLNRKTRPTEDFKVDANISSTESDESFMAKILQAKEHVAQGDVFQLVISRQFKQQFSGDDFEVYRQLRTINPSPYMYYFDLNKAKLIGASPEAQIKITAGKAEIHPIAGTVKRTEDESSNQKEMEYLIQDEKENAEHIMLVDLARNDLNRSCVSVEVEKLKEVQQFSHVIHLVSKVSGQLLEPAPMKTFGGCFPAGTLSGAPKYRAMQLIDQYEAVGRKYYGGAIGLIAANGDVNMAIVIRTALSYQNELTYQAGAGVVMDSTPEGECQEVYNKVKSVQKAIEAAAEASHLKKNQKSSIA